MTVKERKVSIDRLEAELNARDDGWHYTIWEIKAEGNSKYSAQGNRKKIERIEVSITDLGTLVKLKGKENSEG